MADTTYYWYRSGNVVNGPTFAQFLWWRWGWHIIVVGRPGGLFEDDAEAVLEIMSARTALRTGQVDAAVTAIRAWLDGQWWFTRRIAVLDFVGHGGPGELKLCFNGCDPNLAHLSKHVLVMDQLALLKPYFAQLSGWWWFWLAQRRPAVIRLAGCYVGLTECPGDDPTSDGRALMTAIQDATGVLVEAATDELTATEHFGATGLLSSWPHHSTLTMGTAECP